MQNTKYKVQEMNGRVGTYTNFRFLNWPVYEEAQTLISEILREVRKMDREYRIDLGSQIIRSAFSIALNVAEGSGKSSPRELNRFIDIALGSAYETAAGLDTLLRNGLLTEIAFANFKKRLDSICRQLGGLKRKTSLRYSIRI